MKNRLWKAIEGFGNKERSVLTVIADNAADAVDVVYTELKKNPSRAAYLNRWQKTGQRVRPANPGLKKSGFEIEINKSNWSGDKTNLRYFPTEGIFKISHLGGYTFWLETVVDGDDGKVFKIRGDQWGADFELGTVYQYENRSGEGWVVAESLGISRECADNPFIAAAQLLCNTI